MSKTKESEATDALVIFGITGDLAKKMTFRALYRLEKRGKLDCPIIGVGRNQDWHHETMEEQCAEESIRGTIDEFEAGVFKRLADRMRFVAGNFDNEALYRKLDDELAEQQAPALLPGDSTAALFRGRSRVGRRRSDQERESNPREAVRA